MNILADTGVFFRFVRKLPLPRAFESGLTNPANRRFISSISSMELVCKYRIGNLPCPDPEEWLTDALGGFDVLPVTEAIARQAAQWDWDHKDPADRIIAATAFRHGIELWHTDTRLRTLQGFPQRYAKSA